MADWIEYDTQFVRRRYNKLAPIYIAFEYLFLLPPGIRSRAVKTLKLKTGDRVLEIGCGTGRNLSRLVAAVGDSGQVYGVDLSEGMLARAKALTSRHKWQNVKLLHEDAAEYSLAEKVDGALFSLSYATMPHGRRVLWHAWNQLKPGGRLVIMDARIPEGIVGRIYRPMLVSFLKLTVLGNPDIDILEDLRQLAGKIEASTFSWIHISSVAQRSLAWHRLQSVTPPWQHRLNVCHHAASVVEQRALPTNEKRREMRLF